jgi:membrane-bound lytic murein transglycosylase A
MVAQDTGSAIVGPARADIYFGAGADAGRVSGRLRNNARFIILVPKSLDPVARGRNMPLPDPRPSEKIAKLFPQVDAKSAAGATEPAKNATPATAPRATAAAQTSTVPATAIPAVPLPEARPNIQPSPSVRRYRYHYYYHHRYRRYR